MIPQEVLKIYKIITSSQMLLRWIRQEKVEVTMVSKKEGEIHFSMIEFSILHNYQLCKLTEFI